MPPPGAAPTAINEALRELPPEPYPAPVGRYSVAEMRVRGEELLEKEIVIEGYVTAGYDCVEDARETTGWTLAEAEDRPEEDLDWCERPRFYLGEAPHASTATSLWIVEVPRPLTRSERASLPPEIITSWPVVPEIVVGDFVAVQGTWLTETNLGTDNDAGLLRYTRMAPAEGGALPAVSERTSSATTPPAILEISPASLAWAGLDGVVITLDEAGYVSISYDSTAFLAVPYGRLTPRGEFLRIDGTVFATIDDAGNVFVGGRDMKLMVKRDGTSWHRNGHLAIAIADDHTVYGASGEHGEISARKGSRYDGPLGTRRAIIFAKTAKIWLRPDPWPEPVVPGGANATSIAACDVYRAKAMKALACVRHDEVWTKWLRMAIARVDGYAKELPRWGSDATAASCEVGAIRLTAYFATEECLL